MTVGIDGGFVRDRRKAGFFEVIAGKSIVAFRRDEEQDIPSAKRLDFVQTYDTKPRRRLWELLSKGGKRTKPSCSSPMGVRQCVSYRRICIPPVFTSSIGLIS